MGSLLVSVAMAKTLRCTSMGEVILRQKPTGSTVHTHIQWKLHLEIHSTQDWCLNADTLMYVIVNNCVLAKLLFTLLCPGRVERLMQQEGQLYWASFLILQHLKLCLFKGALCSFQRSWLNIFFKYYSHSISLWLLKYFSTCKFGIHGKNTNKLALLFYTVLLKWKLVSHFLSNRHEIYPSYFDNFV